MTQLETNSKIHQSNIKTIQGSTTLPEATIRELGIVITTPSEWLPSS
jgi:hypothetical protein